MAVLALAYPKSLTNDDWQKKKGITNSGTKTGVGEALRNLQKAYASAPYGKLDPVELGDETLDPVVFTKKFNALKQSLAASARSLDPLVVAAEAKINKAIPVFAGNSNQDVRKHLERMRHALTDFRASLDDYADDLADQTATAYRTKLHASPVYLSLLRMDNPTDVTKQLLAKIKKVEAAETIRSIQAEFREDGPHRILTTACKLWDQLLVKQMPQFAKAMGGPASAMTTVADMDWLMDVADEMSGVASKRVKAMAKKSSEKDAVHAFVLAYSKNVTKAQPFMRIVGKARTALGNI